MESCQTKEFGVIDYEESAVVHFPEGLPAFEAETRFLLIEQASTAPVVFLQSLTTPHLMFLALPPRAVDPDFRLELCAEECRVLGVSGEPEPVEGVDYVALALLTVREGARATANLLAPVVIGSQSRRALQVIQSQSRYRTDQPLPGVPAPC